MKFAELPAAVIGGLGERLAAKALRREGAGVIASFKYSANDNEAPAIEFHESRVAIPDLDVSRNGKRFWLEIKTYKAPAFNRAHRCEVHGIPVRLYDGYVAVEKNTGSPVFLGVLQLNDGLLVISDQPISQTTPRMACQCGCESVPAQCEYRRKWGNSYPQWYFRRDTFTAYLKLSGDEFEKIRIEHQKVSHALRKHGLERETSAQPSLFDLMSPKAGLH